MKQVLSILIKEDWRTLIEMVKEMYLFQEGMVTQSLINESLIVWSD